MTKVNITKTKLIWPGKYNEDGARKEIPRVKLPFQVSETINESRATREAKKTKVDWIVKTKNPPKDSWP